MKKLLITSTALVATAGVAFAEVSISGYAEIGMSYVEDRGGNDDSRVSSSNGNEELRLHSDMDVFFKGTGETDGGIEFGFSIDLDEVDNGIGSRGSDGSVFISGDFGTITLGDTDDAFDRALQEVGALTALTDDHTTHAGFSFNGGGNSGGLFAGLEGLTSKGIEIGDFEQDGNGYEEEFVLRYDYSFGDFDLSLSFEQGGDFKTGSVTVDQTTTTTYFLTKTTVGSGTTAVTNIVTATNVIVTPTEFADTFAKFDDTFSIGLGYDADLGGVGLDIGLGYSTNDDVGDSYGISLGISVDAFEVVLNYSETDLDGLKDWTHAGIGATYTIDALSIHANYGEFDIDGLGKATGFGLAVNYDLGGGAVVMFGYGSSDYDSAVAAVLETDDVQTASFGLGLSF